MKNSKYTGPRGEYHKAKGSYDCKKASKKMSWEFQKEEY